MRSTAPRSVACGFTTPRNTRGEAHTERAEPVPYSMNFESLHYRNALPHDGRIANDEDQLVVARFSRRSHLDHRLARWLHRRIAEVG